MIPTSSAACEFQPTDQGPRTRALCDAINRVQAIIAFSLDRHVVHANDNCLHTFGYALQEARNKHHRIFCTRQFAASREYAFFRDRLGKSEFDAGEYRRLDRQGQEIWMQAFYNHVLNAQGRPESVAQSAGYRNFRADLSPGRLRSGRCMRQAIHALVRVPQHGGRMTPVAIERRGGLVQGRSAALASNVSPGISRSLRPAARLTGIQQIVPAGAGLATPCHAGPDARVLILQEGEALSPLLRNGGKAMQLRNRGHRRNAAPTPKYGRNVKNPA